MYQIVVLERVMRKIYGNVDLGIKFKKTSKYSKIWLPIARKAINSGIFLELIANFLKYSSKFEKKLEKY